MPARTGPTAVFLETGLVVINQLVFCPFTVILFGNMQVICIELCKMQNTCGQSERLSVTEITTITAIATAAATVTTTKHFMVISL